MKSTHQLTTHIAVDVPDEHVGAVQRYLAGLKGADNLHVRPNGTARKKGEMPSRMNDGKKSDVVLALIQKNGSAKTRDIAAAMQEAGFSIKGIGSLLTDMTKSKVIKRVSYATYSAPKALPSPKKGGTHAS